MQPLAESTIASELYGPFLLGDTDVLDHLLEVAPAVVGLVQSCTALSFEMPGDQVALTVLDDTQHTAPAASLRLDAVERGVFRGRFVLHATEPGAFAGHVAGLAALVGASGELARHDDDVRGGVVELARDTPTLLRESLRLTIAVGLVSQARDLATDPAEDLLRGTAARVSLPLARVVDVVLGVLQHSPAA